MLESVDALEEQCTLVVSAVLQMWNTRYENNPGSMILAVFMIFIIGKMSFIISFVCLRNKNNFSSFMDMVQELRSMLAWSFFMYHNYV